MKRKLVELLSSFLFCICACQNRAYSLVYDVNDVYYSYTYDLFSDKSEINYDVDNLITIQQVTHSNGFDTYSSEIKVSRDQSILHSLNLWPDQSDSLVGYPFYYAVGVYEDEKMDSYIDYQKLSRPTSELKEIHLRLKTIKEMISDGTIGDWANGKYLDKSGAEVYVSYPNVVAYYQNHYASVQFVEKENPEDESYTLASWQLGNFIVDGKKQSSDHLFAFAKGFDLNNNELLVECCSFYGFVQEFLKKVGVENPSYEPCYGLFKGVRR